jgi:hypothetical protein
MIGRIWRRRNDDCGMRGDCGKRENRENREDREGSKRQKGIERIVEKRATTAVSEETEGTYIAGAFDGNRKFLTRTELATGSTLTFFDELEDPDDLEDDEGDVETLVTIRWIGWI